ncbi:hypothetical protein A1O7_03108 [Cladophialophora yegresii CBS 114405]|uniref:Nuclear protein DGCR14 n=1 Tax=Cladophialophora yegresii CBS 114405 TaxID=1182544 RepID=W9WCF3_9EURO|nr:uncharacterized protein A1O7_03108 [Cladophialophora yegresii CBS 114405]EXJ62670.1 hypothetical protein A1O7_03108 [Cladophialophora yegresii CBS 114405]
MTTTQPSQALVRQASVADVALMPPPPFKRIKRPPEVLDEDEYTQALSDIIARDYFPGLLESQAQHEYLAALDSGNDAWIAEAAQKLRHAGAQMATGTKRRAGARNTRFDSSTSTPSASVTPTTTRRAQDTPLGYTGNETPVSVAGSQISRGEGGSGLLEQRNEQSQLEKDKARLSLGAFQAKYTSEDNESFNTVLDKQNQKRRLKHAHLWTQDQRIPSARQIAYRRAEEVRLLKQKAEAETQPDDDDDGTAEGGKALIPISMSISSGAVDTRPARPDAWKIQTPDNTLMFPASSVDEDHGIPTVQQVREQTSKAGAKEVVHSNTRFPPLHVQYADDFAAVPPSPSLNTDIIANRHRGRGPASEVSGSETPRVNGYAFVDEDEPEPENVHASTNAPAPPSYRDLLAGQVAGDGTPNPFKISEIRKREDLHLRMVERQARKKREKDKDKETTATIRTPGARTPHAGNVTPAARRLMEKLGANTNRTPSRGAGAGDGVASTRSSTLGTLDWTPGRTPRRKTLPK